MDRMSRTLVVGVFATMLMITALPARAADPEPAFGTPLTLFADNTAVEITPLEIVDPAQMVPGEPAPPADPVPPTFGPDGSKLVAVKIKLTTNGYGEYRDVPTESAALIDTNEAGYPADARAITAGKTLGGTVSVRPGSSVTGYLVFEIPKSAKPAHLYYALDRGLSLQAARWQIK